jgi:3-isopropylmalate/(R)-2-methylmalate dehydratase small subunit
MDKVTVVEGVAAHFRQPNIDTDAIISAPYQRSLKHNPGDGLFANWRYDLDGRENPDFILNRPPYRDSRILVGGANFGCGSSREFAVWAIKGFGIGCVIAESFGDIFYENSFKNGILPITLSAQQIAALHDHLERSNDPTLTVDLTICEIRLPNGENIPFAIPASRRNALLQGLDEIGQTLSNEADIASFDRDLQAEQPWIYNVGGDIMPARRSCDDAPLVQP